MSDAPAAREWIEPRPPPPSWLRRKWPLLLAAVAALAVALVVVVAVVLPSADDEAREACREFVRGRLVSPATAQFSGERVIGSDPTVVAGSVDSQNRYGALLRATFSCRIQYDDGADEWRLISLLGV